MLADEDVFKLVTELMADKAKPAQLMRVGATLYRRIQSFTGSRGTGIMRIDSSREHSSGRDDGQALQLAAVQEAADEADGAAVTEVPAVSPRNRGQPRVHQQVAMSTLVGTSEPADGQHLALPGIIGASEGSSRRQPMVSPREIEGGVASSAAAPPTVEEEECIVCYDRKATCVLLECGHGGFCRKCACILMLRPPHECPTCRAHIEQVVELDVESQAPAPVGSPIKIKL